MGALVQYYCGITFLCICLAIYNAMFYSTYSGDVCYTYVVDNGTDSATTDSSARFLKEYNTNFQNRFIKNKNLQKEQGKFLGLKIQQFIQDTIEYEIKQQNTNFARNLQDNTNQDVQASKVESSMHLTTFPLILCISYSAIIFILILGMLSIKCFQNKAPESFGNLGYCMSCLGIWARNFRLITLIFSIVVFFIIFIQFMIIFFVDDCKTAAHTSTIIENGQTTVKQSVGEMYDASIIVNTINFGAWILLHYVFPGLKNTFVDQDAFLYEPYDKTKSLAKYYLCQFFGP